MKNIEDDYFMELKLLLQCNSLDLRVVSQVERVESKELAMGISREEGLKLLDERKKELKRWRPGKLK